MLLRLRVAELALLQKGWTMRSLSEHLNVDHQTVMYWNQGRSFPRLPMMLTLCRVLECKLDDLVEEQRHTPHAVTPATITYTSASNTPTSVETLTKPLVTPMPPTITHHTKLSAVAKQSNLPLAS